MTTLTKAATIDWEVAHGPDIAPDTPGAERDSLLPSIVSAEVKMRRTLRRW